MSPRFRFPWRSRATIAHQVDEELEFHLQMRTRELAASGMTPEAARRQAEQEFGDLERTRAYCQSQDRHADREDRRRDLLDELRGNIRYAFRSIRRAPGFALVTIATLAVAIGANTATFSVASAVLLAPPPYGEPDRLVALYENNTRSGNTMSDMSAADLVDYREMQHTLTGLGIHSGRDITLRPVNGDPVMVRALYFSADMFDILGVRAEQGRTFVPGEDGSGSAHVVVLTHEAWQRLFGGSPEAVGSSVTIEDQPWRVIGVTPKDFGLGLREDIYLPLDMTPLLTDVNRARKLHWLYAVARLKAGVTVEDARADLNAAARSLEARFPEANTGHYVTVLPIRDAMAGGAQRTVWILLGAAALVLLVACGNLANMSLARAMTRSREVMVRAAIGAGRGHLVRQLVTESMVYSALGGVAGVVLGGLGIRLIVDARLRALPALAVPTIDWRVLLFSAAVSVAVGIAIGVLPALRASRADAGGALKGAGRTVGDHGSEWVRGGLAVSQTSMAVALLILAGLLVRSLLALQSVPLGFQADGVLVGRVAVRGPRYQTREAFNAFYDAVFDRLSSSREVLAVGAMSRPPLNGSSGCGLYIEGEPAPLPGQSKEVRCVGARGDFLKALGIPLLKGRAFDGTDLVNGPQVILINQAAARRYFPDRDPVGVRVRLGPDPASPWETIVGVIGDVRQGDLSSDPVPLAIENDRQHGWGSLGIVVRTAGEPRALESQLRAAVREADPAVALQSVQTMDELMDAQLSTRHFTLTLISIFAALGLFLAAIGIYGVLAYAVSSRTREIGVQMALGASPGVVRAAVLRRGLLWSGAGLVLGVSAAMVTARAVRSMLYGIAPADPITLAAVGMMLVVVTVAACFVPARRAVRVDPIVAMRGD